MNNLDEFQETMATETFGLTKKEALEKGICINCKEEALPKCYSDAGVREYRISGLCELCFDEITGE
jgi:hypothetical protein